MNKEKGILLMCHGSSNYGKFAFNMAHSIRHFNKDLPIHLICDQESISEVDTAIFDSFEIIDFKEEDKGDYCLSKISIFERSPFEKTLYLDVDGVCLNDIGRWFEMISNNHNVYSQVMGIGKRGDSISYNPWASNDVIWDRYELTEESVYPTLQTSVVYFDRSPESNKFFEKLKENYSNRLHESEYIEMWGRSKQHPDELYYAVTMAQMNMIPTKSIQPVFFPNRNESATVIESEYLILAMYGAATLIKPYAKDYYNRVMFKVMGALGRNHTYKAHTLYRGKFHTNK